MLYKFECYGHLFYVHHMVDVNGQLLMGTWQFSHDRVPVTYIRAAKAADAHTEFMAYAGQMGTAHFNEVLREVVAANYQRLVSTGVAV